MGCWIFALVMRVINRFGLVQRTQFFDEAQSSRTKSRALRRCQVVAFAYVASDCAGVHSRNKKSSLTRWATPCRRCVVFCATQICMRGARQIDPTGKSLLIIRNHVKPGNQKYSASLVGQISGINPPVSPDKRGGSRSSRTRGGMRWTRRCR